MWYSLRENDICDDQMCILLLALNNVLLYSCTTPELKY